MNTKADAVPGALELPAPPKNALVPFDFSECSWAGLEAARILARRRGLRLELVYVDEGPPAWLSQNEGTGPEVAAVGGYYSGLEGKLKAAAAATPGSGCRVLDGNPAEVLRRLAGGAAADLVVIGSHGYGGLKRFVMGSVAEAMVHSAQIPVLTVHHAPADNWPARILVPMKFTDYADRALLHAVEWAEALGAKLSVVHVLETQGGEREENSALDGHLEALLGADRFQSVGRIVMTGDPPEAILKTAETGRFDLIVLASHLRPFWKDAVLGTTAERVIRHAKIPVLAIPSRSNSILE